MSLSHMREAKLGQPYGSGQIHLELVSCLVKGNVLHRSVQSKSCVVDENVCAFLFRIVPFRASQDVIFLCDVHLDHDRPRFFEISHLLDPACRGVDRLAIRKQFLDGRFAYARRGAGDQHGLSRHALGLALV